MLQRGASVRLGVASNRSRRAGAEVDWDSVTRVLVGLNSSSHILVRRVDDDLFRVRLGQDVPCQTEQVRLLYQFLLTLNYLLSLSMGVNPI